MELRDYLAALRRHWAIWVGATLVGALAGLLVFAVTPKTYEASSTVFVSVSPSIPNSASFVQQRVKSYPEIVTSEAVLAPVMDELDLDVSLAELRTRVSATNPADTTQLHVTVSGTDPVEAAAIANAVSDHFADVVETLETPSSGDEPVHLTVADPAVAPTSPSSPVLLYVLALGVIAGLFLGLAGAVVRSRMDTTLHTGDDVRRAWGEEPGDTEFLVQPSGRARRSALTGQAASTLARRLELRAEERPVRVVVLSPSPSEERATRAFAEQVTAVLHSRGVDATVAGPEARPGTAGDDGARVRLDVVDPLSPLRVWKDVAERYDGVVLVVANGRVDEQELSEMRTVLASAGVTPLAVALVPRGRDRQRGTDDAPRGSQPPAPPARRTPGPAAAAGKRPVLNGADRG
ncbi:YveK family protein [Blastococcus sp. URHD0036]|uniref:YveK family protein n=1 Tax=Blastococcus sp. URHD0036 TaxID=1380356 RepID=UPI00068D4076|nr:Wzz/FepE/Etk N-terminal domain-containing protein [Blastococcus sp. URHD0036]